MRDPPSRAGHRGPGRAAAAGMTSEQSQILKSSNFQLVGLFEIVAVSRAVAEASGRLDKIARLADLLARLSPLTSSTPPWRSSAGRPRQGRDWHRRRRDSRGERRGACRRAVARDSLTWTGSSTPSRRLQAPGSARASASLVRRRCSSGQPGDEQDFLARLLFGELRQGALEGVLLEAVARASGIAAPSGPAGGDAGRATRPGRAGGARAGRGGARRVRRARRFSRCSRCWPSRRDDVDRRVARPGEASLEYKLDGARIQVHKAGDEVRVFSRTLRDVTAAVPEVVEPLRCVRGPRET